MDFGYAIRAFILVARVIMGFGTTQAGDIYITLG